MNCLTAPECRKISLIYIAGYTLFCGFLIFPLLADALNKDAYHILRILITLLLCVVAVLACGRWAVKDFSLFRNDIYRNIISALAAAFLILIVQMVFAAAIRYCGIDYIPENQKNNLAFLADDPFGMMMHACIFAPVLEELFFRGVFCSALPRFGKAAGSLMFGLMHMISSSANPAVWLICFVQYALIGWILADLYLKRKNLTSAMLAHSMMNLAVILLNTV